MNVLVIGALALLALNLNAQIMKDPEETVVTLFVATDQGDWDTVKESFSSSVLLDYSSMTGNPAAELMPEQIVAAWKGILPGFDSTHHQLGNFITGVNGDKAEVFCYGIATHYLADENGNVWTVVGSYDLELVQDSDKNWKVSAMKFNFKYQDGNTSLPEKAMNKIQG